MNNKRAIGIFDSGIGGLSVLSKSIKNLPNEEYLYIGDTKRMPYGEKKPYEVEKYTIEAFRFFEKKDVKAGIIACNTATCYALDSCSERFSFPIIGVVRPACEEILKTTKNRKVLLLATKGTVDSNVYKEILFKLDKSIDLYSLACPKLILAIENGNINDKFIKEIFLEYLEKVKFFDFDTIILGCTHLPHVRKNLEKILEEQKKKIKIVDPAIATVERLKYILKSNYLLNKDENINKNIYFYVSKDLDKFKNNTFKILSRSISSYKFEYIDL